MLRAGALRDGMGREVGGGFRMGNTCTKKKKINILSLGFIGLSYGEQSKLGLSNSLKYRTM